MFGANLHAVMENMQILVEMNVKFVKLNVLNAQAQHFVLNVKLVIILLPIKMIAYLLVQEVI